MQHPSARDMSKGGVLHFYKAPCGVRTVLAHCSLKGCDFIHPHTLR